MPYRDPAATESRRLRYGPFPRTRADGLFALGVFVAFAALHLMGSLGNTLECERTASGGTCVLTREYLFIPVTKRRFGISEVKKVELQRLSTTADNETIFVFHQAEPAIYRKGGEETADRIRAFLFDQPDRRHIRVSARSDLMLLLTIWLPLALAGIAYGLVGFLRRPDFIDLDVTPGESIRVTERWFGLPLRNRTWQLDDVIEVRVVHCKEYNTKLAMNPGRPAGLVSLIAGGNEIRPLSKTPLFGTEVHDRTADALAALIRCEVRRIED